MAITITTVPATTVMAGNPVLIKGTSTIKNQMSPLIIGTFKCGTYTEQYSFPLGVDGKFQFDVSDALQECFRKLQVAEYDNGVPYHDPSVLTWSFKFTEEYLLGGNVTNGDTNVNLGSGNFYAMPGSLTENERFFGATSIPTGLLTRKPSHAVSVKVKSTDAAETIKPIYEDIAVKGHKFIVPYINNGTIYYDETTRNALGKQTVSPMSGNTRYIYVVEPSDNLVPIIFWNSFGLLESVVAYTNKDTQHNITTSQFTVQPSERTFSSIGMQRSQTTLEGQTITLNSGIVDRDWYNWWISEVLASPQLFVYINGRWQPGAVVPSTTIKDESSKGEALTVEVVVKLSVSGVV